MAEYKILKVIGKGAFGDAYLGLNVKEKKQYVIKQVDIKNKSNEEKQHIFNEVKLLQEFNHVNIVQYKDSFIDKKGLLNIVMEYCEGGDMNQLVETLQGNKIPEEKVVYWLSQIALAIFYMHEKKILHRDLKSPNIFILKGNIRLGDFGISKVLDHVRDLAQTNIGTPYYMSPEQYNHKPYSYKSDIWAFGCILYEMCNQRRPFQANNIQALGMKVVRGNFPPVSECYSKQLRQLISDMLQKNPTKRPNIIEILLKPFVKKKLVEYMRYIIGKKEQISKESLNTFIQQAKKLSVVLQEKKPATVPKEQQGEKQKERSKSAKKNRAEEEKEKQRKERERKKEQLQQQLNKLNKERKLMAQKLKKIQEQRKVVSSKRNSEKNLKVIYEKVQATHPNSERHTDKKQYQSQKYQGKTGNDKPKKENEESSKNLVGKILKQNAVKSTQSSQISHQFSKKSPHFVTEHEDNKKHKPQKEVEPLKHIQPIKPTQNKFVEQKKTFKMEQQYQMQFQDCQPEQNYNEPFDQDGEPQQESTPQQFQSDNRLPTFAKDEDKLALQVQQIKNLVQVSNQAVQEMTKKQQKSHPQQIIEPVSKQPQPQPQSKALKQQKSSNPTEINSQVQNLKQQIKMKTQNINSIRNQLSNIDFELSQSSEDEDKNKNQHQKVQIQKPNFKKKEFNPQHVKINDRIATLKQSAVTILGGQQFKKFQEYLIATIEKGRTVKREYIQQVLGKDKIGAYHLVEQIVRLNRVLAKIPKWIL